MQIANPVAVHSSPFRSINHGDPEFCGLSGGTKTQFDALGIEMSYSRGDRIFSEGELPQYVFILRRGRVKLSVTSSEGKTVILRIAEGGHALGLNAVLTTKEHEASAEALEPCQIVAIPAKEFMRFLERHPDAAMEATRCILREYQVVFDDICRLALPTTVAGRLANLLLGWVKRRNQAEPTKPRFTLALTHEEIADMTGTSRETVSRVLQQFQRDKVISVKGASFTVLRPEALAQLAV